MLKKNLRIFALLSTLFILNSCSVATPFFIQNASQKDIELKILYKNSINDLHNYGDYKIVYQNGILTPREFDKSIELKDIIQKQVNDSTLLIEIPKNTTVRIARTSNTYYINHIKSITYDNKELSIEEVLKNSTSKNWKISYKIE